MESASEMYLLLAGAGELSLLLLQAWNSLDLFLSWRTLCLGLVWKLFRRKHFEEREKNPRLFEFVVLELL